MNTPRKAKNIELLVLASECLEPLLDKLVFVGGATTGLLITDPAAPDIRETRDVDVIVEVKHYGEYQHLEQTLINLGFRPDQDEDAPLCRFRHNNLILDVMPTDEKILGFSNPWYQPAIANAESVMLENDKIIRHATAPYFTGTKLAAFEGRGHRDFLASHDFEDIVAVINGRIELIQEITDAESKLRHYIASCLKDFLADNTLKQALPSIIIEGNERAPIVLKRMQQIADLNKT